MIADQEEIFSGWFTSKGLSTKKRDFYINVIRNSKEVTNNASNNEKYEIGNGSFEKKDLLGNIVSFQANISNGNEEKYIHGIIYNKFGKLYLTADVMRTNGSLDESNFIYSYIEQFIPDGNEYLRITEYEDGSYEEYIPMFDDLETISFKEGHVKRILNNNGGK